MGTETEIKLRIPEMGVAGVITGGALPLEGLSFPKWEEKQMASTYYDTPSLDLLEEGIAYRVRQEGDTLIATVKIGGQQQSCLQQRQEWNVEVSSSSPDIEVFFNTGVGSELKRVLGQKREMRPLFFCSFLRKSTDVLFDRDTHVEIAVDTGQITAGELKESICEMELELKRGSLQVMENAARSFSEKYGLIPEPRSKFSRGLALFHRLRDNCPG